MNSLEEKITHQFWTDKLKTLQIVNDQSFVITKTPELIISNDQLAYFNKITAANETLEFVVFLSIYTALLSRYFDTFGAVYTSIKTQDKPLLIDLDSPTDITLKNYLQTVKDEIKTVYKFKNYTSEFQEKTVFKNYAAFGFFLDKEMNDATFPFSLQIKKCTNGISFSIAYSEKFISNYTATHFLKNYNLFLDKLEHLLDQDVEKIAIVSDDEIHEMCYKFNNSNEKFNFNKSIVQLFEEQVENTPNAVALQYEKNTLTYDSLNKNSNQFAHYLIDTYKISSGDLVGVKLARTPHLIIALSAVLKTGAAYVPLDINYPEERISYIEKNSNCKYIIDESTFEDYLQQKEQYSTRNLEKIIGQDQEAYVIYTSGTTGNPKGVVITHKNVASMLSWANEEFKNEAIETVYAVTSHCFDLSVFEIFYSLTTGKRIKLLQDALEIGKNLAQDKNILINTVPSSIRVLLNNKDSLQNVTAINLAGEVFPTDIAEKLLQNNIVVRNLYGPSEDTTYSTVYKLTNKEYKTIPIGTAISGSQAYILDKFLKPVPIGVSGKLYLGGSGVAKGYLHKPKLTQEKFIQSPFEQNEYIYNTGDNAKWLPDGNIEFLGRDDSQIKLRGYRIELEEIQAAIQSYSKEIREVIVLVNNVNEYSTLVAFIVTENSFDTEKIQTFLHAYLPTYMIPHQYVTIDKIPLTPNGKIDKKLLINKLNSFQRKNAFVAPKTELEEKLVQIWKEFLEVEKIGVTDSFFELGGHSLLVGQVINKIYKELNQSITVKSFLETPTIAAIKDKLTKKQFVPIPKVATAAYYPLTTSQKRIWILSQFETGNTAYNISGVLKLIGKVDAHLVEKTLEKLIARHEILRTVFKRIATQEIMQFVLPETDVKPDFEKITFTSENQTEIDAYLKQAQHVDFDLENGPLLNVTLLEKTVSEYYLVFTIHHIISDGWSLELLISEFTKIYNALHSKKDSELTELNIQYKDFAVWSIAKAETEVYQKSKEYWLKTFQGELPVVNFPNSKKRPHVQTHNGKTLEYTFSTSLSKKLSTFAAQNDVTLFMTLFSGINTLIHRYTKQNDIILGTPIAGRNHPDLENQLGLYLNTLAIRTQLNENNTFIQVLKQQKELLTTAYEHKNYPFDELIDNLKLKKDTARAALFDIMVVLQNHQQLKNIQPKDELERITVQRYKIGRETSQFDISFIFIEKETLELQVEFNTDIYDEVFIDKMVAHYEQLISAAIDNKHEEISKLSYITEEEKTLLHSYNNTAKKYEEISVMEMFEKQVEKTPNAIALRYEDKIFTYSQLNSEVNKLANYLIAKSKITANDLIGIHLQRNEQLIVAILATLKTGAAYVPIDLSYPKDKINYIQQDSNCKLLIDTEFLSKYNQVSDAFSDQYTTKKTSENDIAYIIYTSGTTGKSKGVMISHESFADYVITFKNYFKLTADDKITQQSSIAFDTAIEEIFPILTCGGELILLKDRTDLNALFEACEKHEITLLSTNPYVLQFLNEHHREYKLNFKTIISGGDTLKSSHIQNIYQKFPIYNTYGPTESTVCTTYHKINSITQTPAIGKPIANREVYIIDPYSQELQPIGIPGELCISGKGLALGYLNQPELTNEKFIAHPYKKGKKLYKSGDLACWLSNGTINFLGRIDRQVKLRGYRIELGEIEHIVNEFDNHIKNTVVTVKIVEDEKFLVVYFNASKKIDKSQLKSFLQQKLPEFMVPAFYVQIEKIPLTHNGKVNYKRLPDVSEHDLIRNVYEAPQNDTEEKLVTIWEEILGIENIGVTDNFFELGGHSMKIIQLSNKIQQKFSYKMKIKDLYEKPTIKYQALKITEDIQSATDEVVDRIII